MEIRASGEAFYWTASGELREAMVVVFFGERFVVDRELGVEVDVDPADVFEVAPSPLDK